MPVFSGLNWAQPKPNKIESSALGALASLPSDLASAELSSLPSLCGFFASSRAQPVVGLPVLLATVGAAGVSLRPETSEEPSSAPARPV